MTTTQLVEHQFDDGKHTFTFVAASRAAVDIFFNEMDAIYADVDQDTTIRLLIDYRQSGLPPISYAISQGRKWARQLKVHPPAKMAIVTQSNFTITLFDMLLRTLNFGHLQTRFFNNADGYEQANLWLEQPF